MTSGPELAQYWGSQVEDALKFTTEEEGKMLIPDYNAFTVNATAIPSLTPTEMIKTDLFPSRRIIADSALDLIGSTPMMRLDRFAKASGVAHANIFAKLEFMNIGGSIKDRIGKQMVEAAESSGELKPNGCIVEASSGNAAIGLALVAAVKQHGIIITMPEKMSDEKENTLISLGAHVIRTPTKASWDDSISHLGVARRLQNYVHKKLGEELTYLDQYQNIHNVGAHVFGTGAEIVEQMCAAELLPDYVVATAGTGGTITGLAHGIKGTFRECKVVGVDPEGSILAYDSWTPDQIKAYNVEGIGYDFHPSTLDRKLIDEWETVNDTDSFNTALLCVRTEGLLVGGSCGTALAAAVRIAAKAPSGTNIVVILPDTSRNYVNKLYNKDWMVAKGFGDVRSLKSFKNVSQFISMENSQISKLVVDGQLKTLSNFLKFPSTMLLEDVMKIGLANEVSAAIVVDKNQEVVGAICMTDVQLMSLEKGQRFSRTSEIGSVITNDMWVRVQHDDYIAPVFARARASARVQNLSDTIAVVFNDRTTRHINVPYVLQLSVIAQYLSERMLSR